MIDRLVTENIDSKRSLGAVLVILALLAPTIIPLVIPVASAAGPSWDPLIEVTTSNAPVDGTIYIKLTGKLDCSLSNHYVGGSTVKQARCLSDQAQLLQIVYGDIIVLVPPTGAKHIWKGGDITVPAGGETTITYGTYAPDAAKWYSSSTTAFPGRYIIDFSATSKYNEGKFFTNGRIAGFDVIKTFQVPEFSLPAAIAPALALIFLIAFRGNLLTRLRKN